MLTNPYTVSFPETLNLAVQGSAVHFAQMTQQAQCRRAALTLNGTTINSAADVEVTLDIVGGAVLIVLKLPPGSTAGQCQIRNVGAAIPAGSVVRATVTVPSTAAAGSGSITLSLSNG